MLSPFPPGTDEGRDASGGHDPVRDLYRRYPYPPIEATDEGGLSFALLGALDYVRHVFWPGRRSLAGLRVLDAGCGTGATAVQIARDHPEVEVTGIDISEASLAIARERAARHGVGANLTLRIASIEDLSPEYDTGAGPGAVSSGYDYIVAAGVLHHLRDPVLGARRLAALLAPTGGIAVMLYATYGRFAVYLVQDLLRRLGGGLALPEQVTLARSVLPALPDCHPFARSHFGDHQWQGDAGLVDLLLHPRDRSYTVPEVLALARAAGLRFQRFLGPARYLPETYLADPTARARLAALADDERPAVAELLHGAMAQHTFFATRPSYQPVRPPAAGLPLLAQRGRRTPLLQWPAPLAPAIAGRRDPVRLPGPAPVREAVVTDFPNDPLIRSFELDGWNLDTVAAFDDELTGWQVFDLPHIQTAIPGATRDAKLEAFGTFLQDLASHEILLFDL